MAHLGGCPDAAHRAAASQVPPQSVWYRSATGESGASGDARLDATAGARAERRQGAGAGKSAVLVRDGPAQDVPGFLAAPLAQTLSEAPYTPDEVQSAEQSCAAGVSADAATQLSVAWTR